MQESPKYIKLAPSKKLMQGASRAKQGSHHVVKTTWSKVFKIKQNKTATTTKKSQNHSNNYYTGQ